MRCGRAPDATIEVAEVSEVAPPKGGRLVPSETIQALLARATYHECSTVVADQHYIETVREHAGGFHLVEAPGGAAGKTDAHLAARALINEGRVRIGAGQTRLLAQLREVQSKPSSGGQLTITSPRTGGAHGDIASAFVLALWAAYTQRHRSGVPVIGTATKPRTTAGLMSSPAPGSYVGDPLPGRSGRSGPFR